MHRLVSFLAVSVLSVLTLAAQPAGKPAHTFNIGVQGGAALSLNENAFTYRDNDKGADLFNGKGDIMLGYTFSGVFAMRLAASFGKNSGACNTEQTSGDGFYPYHFKSVNVFADAILNLSRSWEGFSPLLYAGIGGARSFGFSDAAHPWQSVSNNNNALGFRLGFIAQYNISSAFSIYADFCGEAYSDKYDGLKPHKKDQQEIEGYGGFPLDLRGVISLGIVFHY